MPSGEEKREVDDAYKTAGSYRQELQDDIAGQTMGPGAGTDVPGHQGTNGEKETPSTTGANPKRTENSRAD